MKEKITVTSGTISQNKPSSALHMNGNSSQSTSGQQTPSVWNQSKGTKSGMSTSIAKSVISYSQPSNINNPSSMSVWSNTLKTSPSFSNTITSPGTIISNGSYNASSNQGKAASSLFPPLSSTTLPQTMTSSIPYSNLTRKPILDDILPSSDFPALAETLTTLTATTTSSAFIGREGLSSTDESYRKSPTHIRNSSLPDTKDNSKRKPSSGSNPTSQTTTSTNTPFMQNPKSTTYQNNFALTGLLDVIRMTDPDLTTLALGMDLASLGLDLTSGEPLYMSFVSPWGDSPHRIDQLLPPCYQMPQPPPPLQNRLNQLMDDSLLYLFYGSITSTQERDLAMQDLVSKELCRRGWRWHKELHQWVSKENNDSQLMSTVSTSTTSIVQSPPTYVSVATSKSSNIVIPLVYIIFDPIRWEKVKRELAIPFDALVSFISDPSGSQPNHLLKSPPPTNAAVLQNINTTEPLHFTGFPQNKSTGNKSGPAISHSIN